MPWTKVATTADLAPEEVIEVIVGDQSIALYNVEGAFYATHNICTHGYAKLHRGYLEDCRIECPLHQGVFDVRTGEPLEGPVNEKLRVFNVKVDGDDILVET
ncbi:MAG: non-heme iron oxygenase ferredoxin subunit [Rhodospirillaceae bacterium]|nr:non-heme iron oxygenase ferredoxin subunit [Rhodospirillaceae bacterium]